jgi:hypothetical protein
VAPAAAQTVLKIGYTPVKDSHYGVGATVFCDEIDQGHGQPLHLPAVPELARWAASAR